METVTSHHRECRLVNCVKKYYGTFLKKAHLQSLKRFGVIQCVLRPSEEALRLLTLLWFYSGIMVTSGQCDASLGV